MLGKTGYHLPNLSESSVYRMKKSIRSDLGSLPTLDTSSPLSCASTSHSPLSTPAICRPSLPVARACFLTQNTHTPWRWLSSVFKISQQFDMRSRRGWPQINFSVKCEISPNDHICINDTSFQTKKNNTLDEDKHHDLSSKSLSKTPCLWSAFI